MINYESRKINITINIIIIITIKVGLANILSKINSMGAVRIFSSFTVDWYLNNKEHSEKHDGHQSNMPARVLAPHTITKADPSHCHCWSHESRTLHC